MSRHFYLVFKKLHEDNLELILKDGNNEIWKY